MRESVFRIARTAAKEIKKQSVDQMVDQIMALPEGTRLQLLARLCADERDEHEKVLERAARSGYVRVRIDGNLMSWRRIFSWIKISSIISKSWLTV